jgi:UDP-N-acetylmuramoyl-L-alanyl-D-glutamate--2,6-diaminopimelate ligase
LSLPLSTVAARAVGARLHGAGETAVEEVCYDSRRARHGSLFVAIPGLREDGLRYVDSALQRGAVAVAAEVPPSAPVPWVQVPNARQALAVFSAALLGDPSERLDLVGITGTNGKTTTAYMVEATLTRAGRTPGLVGTVQHRIAGQARPASHTTPESSDLQALFRAMVDAGCDSAAVEVSSHALHLGRVHGCRFRVAVFTNLSRDHLDLHGDMDSYFQAKRLLFSELLREDGVAVINADDARAAELVAASRGRVLTFSLESDADLTVARLNLGLERTTCAVRTPLGEYTVETPLIGRFNVRNLLGAFGACLALELDPAVVADALGRFPGAPGRMERIHAGQDFAVIVDYAHTDEALRNLLETVRELAPARLITVFGC